MLGAASQEYSVAYFGFDSSQIMEEFIQKYHNFVVEVDNKRKYCLEVSRAWYQPMPTLLKNKKKAKVEEPRQVQIDTSSGGAAKDDELQVLEQLDDFKAFKKNQSVNKPALLPLEMQIEIQREKERAAEEEQINIDKVHFREAAGSDYDSGAEESDLYQIDKYQMEMEGRYGQVTPEKRGHAGAKHNSDQKQSLKKLGNKPTEKIAPLVAALNEQAAAKSQHHSLLSEHDQLLRKNKKKANQQKRKQQQKQKKREDK